MWSVLFLLIAAPVQAQREMRVYIAADMEGIAGLSATDDPAGRALMTGEVNAAIEAAFEAGAVEVVVNDAHGGHNNLIQEALDQRVRLLRGNLKPYGMMEGLDERFTHVLFIGFHAKAGEDGFAAHTGSGLTADLKVNGMSVGEGGMNALYAAWYDVPVVFVSGDQAAIDEMTAMIPGLTGVAVKEGTWTRSVNTMSPDSARAAIHRGVLSALRAEPPGRPAIRPPFSVEFTYPRRLNAEIAMGIPWLERVDETTVGFEVDEYPAAYRLIRLLYKHLQP